jgi:hypothetical protein
MTSRGKSINKPYRRDNSGGAWEEESRQKE